MGTLKPISAIVAAVAALSLLNACTTSEPEMASAGAQVGANEATDPRKGDPVRRVCFVGNIDNFRETTRQSVVIEAGVNDFYLIETVGPCLDLDRALTIGVDTFGPGNCVTRGDAILASQSAFSLRDPIGIGPQRCTIGEIYAWDPDAETAEGTDNDSEDANEALESARG